MRVGHGRAAAPYSSVLDGDIETKLGEHEVGSLLTTIDGVGPATAAKLVAELGDSAHFDGPRERSPPSTSASDPGAAPVREALARVVPGTRASATHAYALRCGCPRFVAVRCNP